MNPSRPLIPRRAFINTVVLTLIGSATGCADILNEGVRLNDVRVVNEAHRQVIVHLIVEYDSELTYWSDIVLPAASLSVNDTNSFPSTTIDRKWPPESGQIKLFARLNQQSSWQRLDLTTLGADCVTVRVHVQADEQSQPSVVIWHTAGCSRQ